MDNLALTYHHQGRLKEAEDLEELVMETRNRVLRGDHPARGQPRVDGLTPAQIEGS